MLDHEGAFIWRFETTDMSGRKGKTQGSGVEVMSTFASFSTDAVNCSASASDCLGTSFLLLLLSESLPLLEPQLLCSLTVYPLVQPSLSVWTDVAGRVCLEGMVPFASNFSLCCRFLL